MQHIFPNIPSLCSGLIPYPLILNAYRAFPITYVVSHPLPSPHLTSPHLTSPHPLLPNTYETLPIPHPLSIHTGRFLRPPAMSHPHPIPSHPIPSHPIPSHPIPPLHNFTASLANFQNPTHTHTHVLYTQENKTAQDTPPQARTPSRLQNARQEYMWNNLIRADTYLWKHSFSLLTAKPRSLIGILGKKVGFPDIHPSIHPSKQVICTHARQNTTPSSLLIIPKPSSLQRA